MANNNNNNNQHEIKKEEKNVQVLIMFNLDTGNITERLQMQQAILCVYYARPLYSIHGSRVNTFTCISTP